ncbi:MAG: DUF393 domain-containing protein [Candidatus Zixiibacteriota bacterium]|nr:MAG: DUF393 domain-containing protein [candidate division Zixibacteria bacterium]
MFVILRMGQYHLIYDDNCPICRKSISTVRNLDRLGLVNCVPLSTVTDQPRRGTLVKGKLAEEIHLITPEGKVYRGAEAVGVLASLFPRSKYLGAFILLPGVRALARRAYRRVARRRLMISRLLSLN